MTRIYKLEEGSTHEKFQLSRAKIQLMGGGFGNGKTTAGVIKALNLMRDYPGSSGLIARSTYPKLNDTVRKEFIAWCPPDWIKRKALSTDNVIELTNSSSVNFRYIAQQGKSTESSTSNLLSATYDWILIDQIEDPEITHKDFLDLLGRLRGNATYVGEDTSMPGSGPRWFMVLCNPTRNWVYKELVKPVHDKANGIRNPKLIVDPSGNPLIEIFEGSTYENANNVAPDFISTLEATYKGQMRDRFLMGKWAAYEGLVYPEYDPTKHLLTHSAMLDYFHHLYQSGFAPTIIEGYDHGIAAPACYGFGFVDHNGIVFLMDGFHLKEQSPESMANEIKRIRRQYIDYSISDDENGLKILADPAIFRRASGTTKTVGVSVAGLFKELGINMVRGNNDILSGIAKVQGYLHVNDYILHPLYMSQGSPRLFVSDKLEWFDQEITDYYWKRDTSGEYEDVPMDRNDHGMDMTKYLLSRRPRLANVIQKPPAKPERNRHWREVNRHIDQRNSRHV